MRQSQQSINHESPQRMEQLDGLRAIAVLMVFYHHFMPWSYQLNLPWGDTGVNLFFVLSGFLITRILLQCRKYTEIDGQTVTMTLRQFYTRRFLRIFPLYYVVLLILTVFAHSLIHELTPWLWTYTLNIYRSLVNTRWGSPISHMWSLSVEEQFYLVWPWVILLVPRRLLFRVIVLAMLTGPAAKLIITINGGSWTSIRYFTLSCLDTLALGALLAYWVDQKGLTAVSKSTVMTWLLRIILPIMFAGLWLNLIGYTSPKLMLPLMSAITLFCGWVVIKSSEGFSGLAGRFLALPPIMYLGKISYGLYLIHKPIPYLLRNLGVPVNLFSPIVAFLIYTVLSIIIASLSWHLFESPVNALKRLFPYRLKNRAEGTSSLLANT